MDKKRILGKIYLKVILIFISILFGLPHLYGLYRFGNGYSPFISNIKLQHIHDETYIYAAQTQQMLKGYISGDPYIWENRFGYAPFLSEQSSIIFLTLLSIITFSVSNAFIMVDFLFPVLLVFLIYRFLVQFGYRKNISLTSALGVVVIPYLSVLFPHIFGKEVNWTGPSDASIYFSRTIHPEVSSIYLFLCLFLTVWVLKKPHSKIIFLWSVVIGLSFYSSPFIGITVALSTIILLLAMLKNIPIKRILMVSGIIGLIGLPWLINFYMGISLHLSEFINRFSFPRNFLFPLQVRFIILAIIYFLINRRNKFSLVLLVYIFTASFLTDAHQVIFNRSIQADHFIARILAPLGTLVLFLIIEKISNKILFKFRINILWAFIVFVTLIIGYKQQVKWLKTYSNDLKFNPEYRKIINNINSQTEKENVIGTLLVDLNNEIAANTGRWVYIAPGDRSTISLEEDVERTCNLYLLSGESNRQNAYQNVNYALFIASGNRSKLDYYRGKLDECINKGIYTAKYRLDYLVKQDNNTGDLVLINFKDKRNY